MWQFKFLILNQPNKCNEAHSNYILIFKHTIIFQLKLFNRFIKFLLKFEFIVFEFYEKVNIIVKKFFYKKVYYIDSLLNEFGQ